MGQFHRSTHLLKYIAIVSSVSGVILGIFAFVCDKTCNCCKSTAQESPA
ncbi:MAG: hypothetical protein KR126chlam4_01381 [Candidatus Anoxychlamydiales bacterium]|nr:hypothetical protein [Candidatus Anoxychlamydiales bacterium]NGX41540.1 hypothetical protein [Candidatus Anoxychlamydiales bacterium]